MSAAAKRIRPLFSTVPNNFIDKNSKEAFLKKLQICMKNFDYKDETKDVRGKVRPKELNACRLSALMRSTNFSRCSETRKTSPR